jgi:hypothetical protein
VKRAIVMRMTVDHELLEDMVSFDACRNSLVFWYLIGFVIYERCNFCLGFDAINFNFASLSIW